MTDGVITPVPDNEPVVSVQDRRASFALPGLLLAGGALVCATLTLFILLGVTPIAPTTNVVIASAVVNSLFIIGLVYLIGREIGRLLRARNRGRAAARLHVRIVVLFSIVAITPAVLVAIFASLTLSVGLDRWFSLRTQSIVQSSQDVARAYMMENASYLQGQTVSMSNDLERNRAMFYLDRTGFVDLLTRQARGRGLLGAFLVQEDGQAIAQADIKTEKPLPAIPQDALKTAASGQPTLIPPGVTNLVGAVIKIDTIPGTFLYTIRAVDPRVMNAMRLMEENTAEYKAMEAGRMSLQLAFAVLYLGFALIVLLAAIWAAIAVADRIVRPIRLLISAADSVATGNLNVVVPVRVADGDVGSLGRTFNKMISEIRTQRDEILEAKDEVDDRRRFIEAVLSGVTAAVIGVEEDRRISIVNPTAEAFLGVSAEQLMGKKLEEVAPEIDHVFTEATSRSRGDFRKQVNLMRGGKERTLSVQVTREEQRTAHDSYVVTLDDITDLVIAQRSTAWADVARRIAHEIKNPLTPIQLSAERIRRKYRKDITGDLETFDRCTETIIRQVGDIGRMVDEFSAFARMPAPRFAPADLAEMLRQAVFAQRVVDSEIDVILNEPGQDVWISCDARMVGQALTNILKNAGEAVSARRQISPEPGGRIVASLVSTDDDLCLVVEDNGVGLPSRDRERLTEPYVTTREKGTGLGLAIVKRIMEDHEGELVLTDALEETGARVVLKFPTTARLAADKAPSGVEEMI